MGNKTTSIDNKKGSSKSQSMTSLEDLPVDQEMRHQLLVPRLPSRLATAVILGFTGRRKLVIKTLLVINKSGRAYIIT